MKIICMSDSHSETGNLYDIIEREKDAKYVVFLGDGLRDIEGLEAVFTDKTFYLAQGNCDIFSAYPTLSSFKINNKKIVFTHGHNFGVKTSLLSLKNMASEQKADICLFGHTHTPFAEFFNNILFLNPGSVNRNKANNATYAVIEITDKINYEIKNV